MDSMVTAQSLDTMLEGQVRRRSGANGFGHPGSQVADQHHTLHGNVSFQTRLER